MAKYFKIICSIITFQICLSPNLLSQFNDIRFERLSVEEGLSHSYVNCIIQDRQKFMWFGTQDGLNRYDGYNFTIFKHDPGKPQTISNNCIWAIHQDRSGNLWIGTSRGLNKFDPTTETFSRYLHDDHNPNSLSHNDVRAICEDSSGRLWIGTAKGLNKFDPASQTFTHYRHDPSDPNSLSHDFISVIYEDSFGVLWIGTGDYAASSRGLNRLVTSKTGNYESEQATFKHYLFHPDSGHEGSNWITSIFEGRAGMLWVGTDGGLQNYNRSTDSFVSYQHDPNDVSSLSKNNVKSIFEDKTGTLWIGTWGGGLNRFDKKSGKFTHFLNNPLNPGSLSNNKVLAIYPDRFGDLWIGTAGSGINKFNPAGKLFSHYKRYGYHEGGPAINDVRAVYEDDSGVLWIGTWWDLHTVNRKTGIRARPWTYNYTVLSLGKDPSGNMWVGQANGLVMIDKTTGRFTRYRYSRENPRGLMHPAINAMYIDSSGTLWLGTWGGLHILVPNEIERFRSRYPALGRYQRDAENLSILFYDVSHLANFKRYTHEPDNPRSLSHNVIKSILEDKSGMIWVGTMNGLNKFDRAKKTFTRFLHDPENPKSLSSNDIRAIFEDSSGILWIGTLRGLNKFDRQALTFTHFTEKDGLPSYVINAILGDSEGSLWLSTNKGLSKFNTQTGIFKNYDATDGLQGNQFNLGAFYKNKKGEMFFGGTNGLTIFHPDSIRDNPQVPPIVLTRFKKFNQEVKLDTAISRVKLVTLSYKDNVFSFEFAALNYTNPQKNQYAYRMDGFDEDWIYAGNKREATYTSLDPGEYVFHVKGSNNDGVWNEDGVSVRIVITPPWWRTGWAYAGYAILFAIALYGLRQFEFNRARLRNELKMRKFEAQKLHEVDQMKSSFFTNISHEFRTPLTLILGPIEKMLTRTTDDASRQELRMVRRNARRLQRLINLLLDLSKLEANHMPLRAKPTNIVSLLKDIVMSFASLAERKRISLTFNASEQPVMAYVDRDKVEKIISNLLSNAFKFTAEGGKISVDVSVCQDGPRGDHKGSPAGFAEIAVKDTGKGIPPERLEKVFDRFYQVDDAYTREQEGTGIGLALTKELVELHHGEIHVDSEVERGTTFVVRLPLGKDHLGPEQVLEDIPAEPESAPSEHATSEEIFEDKKEGVCKPEASKKEPLPRLLIVEDNRDVRVYMRGCLERDYAIVEAKDGEAGLRTGIAKIPELVISDVMMPKMDGFELCRKLKADERTSHIPVILLTARASRESKVEGLETGADDYIIKPFDARELQVRVKNLVEQRRKLRERFQRELILQPGDVTVPSADTKFLKRALTIVEEHMADFEFNVETFAHKVAMSRMQLHRKLHSLTGLSASRFIRTMRLKRAAQLLKQRSGNIAEIVYEVGFNNIPYFNKCFREQFGLSPSEFITRQSPTQQ